MPDILEWLHTFETHCIIAAIRGQNTVMFVIALAVHYCKRLSYCSSPVKYHKNEVSRVFCHT